MRKAVRIIYDMSEDTKLREIARLREKALHDEASLMNGTREEGIKQGIAQGIARGKAERDREIIANLKAMGLSDEMIEKALKSE